MNKLMSRLDRLGFCGIQIWDFSFRSLGREYGRLFFLKAVVAHPVKAARGLLRYRRFVGRRGDRAAGHIEITAIAGEAPAGRRHRPERQFVRGISARGDQPLIGLGFCLKPVDPADPDASCPSGRANHDCLYLERGETRPACRDCAILEIGRSALEKGCPVYIMTSAKDIARDFMFPQLERRAFPSAVLLLCPYSIQAIILPLLICGVSTLLVPYSSGSCADYGQWLRADIGIKPERTALSPDAGRSIRAVLVGMRGGRPRRRQFRRVGNIFFPD